MSDVTAELSSLDCVHVGHAREMLEQQLAEAQQHASAKEEDLKKAKEDASITESTAALREQKHLATMTELIDVNDSYSRCKEALDSAAAQIKGLQEDLDSAHREATDSGKPSGRKLSACSLLSVIIPGNLRSAACCMFQPFFRGTTDLHSPLAVSITEWTAGSAASDEMVCVHTAFVPLTPDCTSLCAMSATANALLPCRCHCKTAVVLISSSVLDHVRHVLIAMTDSCSFWRKNCAGCTQTVGHNLAVL